jgi:metallo-beta-lactamase family protein
VGYQAEGTLGRQIVEGATEVKIFGETIRVGAEIHNLEGFSGHADQNGLLDWVSGFQVAPKQIFLVHGEPDSKRVFSELLRSKFGYDSVVITENSEFELETGELLSTDDVILDAMDEEDVAELKCKIKSIKSELATVLSGTENVMTGDVSPSKLREINNIILELEKASANLGASITAEDRDTRPLTEQMGVHNG